MSKTRFSTIVRTAVVLAFASTMVGCASTHIAQSPDRTERRPHTAMRGPAHKRLVTTLNESHHLSLRANQNADALNASGQVDEMTVRKANELAHDAEHFADDVEWSVANNQRMKWHRVSMDELWHRYLHLYPQEKEIANAYRSEEMRKTSYKAHLKRDFREKWDLDYAKVRDMVMERQRKAFLESM